MILQIKVYQDENYFLPHISMYLVFVDEVEAEAEVVVEAVAMVRFQDSLLAWRLEYVAKLILIKLYQLYLLLPY